MEVIKSQKISIFEVLDYIFCPRIIYYENVLKMFGEKKGVHRKLTAVAVSVKRTFWNAARSSLPSAERKTM